MADNPMLRVTYAAETVETGPLFITLPDVQPPLEVVPCAPHHLSTAWEQRMQAESVVPYAPSGCQWSAILFEAQTDAEADGPGYDMHMCWTFSHAICDGTSRMAIITTFMQHIDAAVACALEIASPPGLGDTLASVPSPGPCPSTSPVPGKGPQLHPTLHHDLDPGSTLPASLHALCGEPASERVPLVTQKVVQFFTSPSGPVPWPAECPPECPVPRCTALLHFWLDATATAALLRQCKAEQTSLFGVVAAATAHALLPGLHGDGLGVQVWPEILAAVGMGHWECGFCCTHLSLS